MNTEYKTKLSRTMEIFDGYELRFTERRLAHPKRQPWIESDRAEILAEVKRTLAFDDSLIPEIRVICEQETVIDKITARHMLFESWKDFYGIATLFIPNGSIGRSPLVIVCPGHGNDGRLTKNYQRMARQAASQGAYALVVENIGQGCRKSLGHADVPGVFYCGLTVQGLIIAETRAWVRYMKNQPYIDSSRIGICGNSGGGTLTQFLCALEEDVAVTASSGYPSEYEYIFQKERRHCDCNILPGVIGRLEMWEVYSLFAPKPLLLECGQNDHLIPVEYFQRNARRVGYVYEMMGHGENFRKAVTATLHSWDEADLKAISNFLADTLKIGKPDGLVSDEIILLEAVTLTLPENCITVERLAERISGKNIPEGLIFEDVFVPTFNGEPIRRDDIVSDLGRGDLMRVFAQFEAVLRD